MIRLIFHSGDRAGTEVVTSAETIQLGRDPDRVDIAVDDLKVSGVHCGLSRSPRGDYLLEDLGSSNGTKLNGQPLVAVGPQHARYLAHGDRITLGEVEIEVRECQVKVMVVSGSQAGSLLPLRKEAVTLGRAQNSSLVFSDEQVSAHHAAILPLPVGFVLQDNGSSNGTKINGERTERQILGDGDQIKIGNNELRFLIDDVGVDPIELLDDADEVEGNLVFVSGPHEGTAVPIGKKQTVFGRRSDCTSVLEDFEVSGTHFAVTPENGVFQVTDLKSTNGTYLNGKKISGTVTLHPGDVLAFGQSVLEVRIAGGRDAAASATFNTVQFSDGSAKPKFIIDGRVVATPAMTIGRGVECDIRVESERVSALHCTIAWEEESFVLTDSSRFGTFVDDKRVVSQVLQSGSVVRVGPLVVRVEIRGDRCTVETVDAAKAMAAIEIAREKQFDIRLAKIDPKTVLGAHQGAYKTVFKLDVPDIEALVKERKAKFQEGAPAWRPSSDISPEKFVKVAVLSAGIVALAIVVGLYTTKRASALINHPLSEAHSDVLFANEVSTRGFDDACAACHTAGRGVPRSACAGCHTDYDKHGRTEHQTEGGPSESCSSCHAEHRGTRRKDEKGNSIWLGAGNSCSQSGCHPNQHEAEFLREAAAPPGPLYKAGPVPTFALSQEDFHARHAVVTQEKKEIEIGCPSCHARGTGEKTEIGAAGRTCFFCHEGGEEFVNSQCASCHNDEHVAASPVAFAKEGGEPSAATSVPAPERDKSLIYGGLFAFASFLPLILFGAIRRTKRENRSMQVANKMSEMPTQVVKLLVHSINEDKCVGCHLCIQACPASVLELVNHKSVVVNFDACIQCMKCEYACSFDALRMHEADKPPPTVAMPDVDRFFQSSVKGLYLIGQASGTPQVKNASNLGRAAVEHIVQTRAEATRDWDFDIVIVGSGPAGLSAALSCKKAGLSYVVLEKQRDFAWTVRSYYHKGKPVMAEPDDVEIVGLLPHWDTNREELLAKWAEVIAKEQLEIRYQQNVVDIQKTANSFAVMIGEEDGETIRSQYVILAIGTMGNPRKLGCPGDDLEKVKNALVDPDEFDGANILVVGGTDSAIEVALALGKKNNVVLSCRRQRFDRVKPKNLKLIEDAFKKGRCKPAFGTTVSQITETEVELTDKATGETKRMTNEIIFAMVGGHPPIKWLESIGIRYAEKPHSWSPPKTDLLVRELSQE